MRKQSTKTVKIITVTVKVKFENATYYFLGCIIVIARCGLLLQTEWGVCL